MQEATTEQEHMELLVRIQAERKKAAEELKKEQDRKVKDYF